MRMPSRWYAVRRSPMISRPRALQVLVGPAQGQVGLPDTAGAADRRDHHRAAGTGVLVESGRQ
ncbi:hypothetical protein, partial [Streptomyces sp. KR80]|uniref:hypothetical protein n=1 Tax=Streptomyces sp. KR80 TaxID=3457426 RepID=UPI003FD16B6E